MEKLLPELFLKVKYLLAERWLGNEGALRGLCKTACLRDSQEVTQLVYFHS
jgi:hypothetical protein